MFTLWYSGCYRELLVTIPRKIENFSNSSQIFKFLFKNLKSRKRRSNPPMIKTVSVRSRGTAAVFAIVGHWPTHHQLFHPPNEGAFGVAEVEKNRIKWNFFKQTCWFVFFYKPLSKKNVQTSVKAPFVYILFINGMVWEKILYFYMIAIRFDWFLEFKKNIAKALIFIQFRKGYISNLSRHPVKFILQPEKKTKFEKNSIRNQISANLLFLKYFIISSQIKSNFETPSNLYCNCNMKENISESFWNI